MARLLVILIVLATVAAGCVVVEREVQSPERDEPPADRSPDDIPTAEPRPLQPSSDRRLVGSLGWALLSSDVPNAVLEIDEANGATMSQEAVAAIERALQEHGRKESVELVKSDISVDDEVFSLEDLIALSDEHRDRSSGDDTVAVHVLVLPGRFETEGVPGAAFGATAIALFPQEVRRMLPAGAEIEAFEAAVAVHELGHAFGLVNRTGVGEFHEDPEHPGHTADEDSVMYWAIESPSLGEIFRTGPPNDFNEDDRREMERIREQRP